MEAAEDVETKVLKQKSSEGHVHRKIRREEKVLVEHTETGEIIIHHKVKTINSEHQSKHKRIEEKDRPKTKLITSISPERADNIDVKEKVKTSMSLECSFKREEVMQDTSKLRIEEINIAKLDTGSSPKIPFRSPDKPITISLVSSADNIVDTNDSPVCERRTNIEYTKNSGSRSNIYEKQEKEPVKLASQITPLRLSSDLLPQEMDARVEVIEALISGKYTPENTPLNLSGEIVSLPSDHVIQ